MTWKTWMLVASSFSLANSLISADVLSAATQQLQKQIVSKLLVLIFYISCNKNRLENWKHFSARRINCRKLKTTIKRIRIGDLNLGTVGNRKHVYFFVSPKLLYACGWTVNRMNIGSKCSKYPKTFGDIFIRLEWPEFFVFALLRISRRTFSGAILIISKPKPTGGFLFFASSICKCC